MTITTSQALVASIYEASSLRKIQRSHQQTLLTSDASDNIASHSYLVSFIGLILAHIVPGANPARVLQMCLLHDLSETRTGDQNWLHKAYVTSDEDAIRELQLAALVSLDPALATLMKEYDERESIDSKVAKDADGLAQIVLLREYAHAGNREAERWLETRDNKKKRLFTEAAKGLFDEIMEQRPSAWWNGLQSATRKKSG